jgi:hypothetical protein
LAEHSIDPTSDLLKARSTTRIAFPYCLNSPVKRSEFCSVTLIARDIRCKLGTPVVVARFWTRGEATSSMLVPKTPVNENCEPVFRENDIRLSGKIPAMQPESKA